MLLIYLFLASYFLVNPVSMASTVSLLCMIVLSEPFPEGVPHENSKRRKGRMNAFIIPNI
jgi:hypothetical protein